MTTRVFVTGLGMVTALGLDTASTWNNLIHGVSGIDHISLFDPEGLESRIAAEVKGFNPTDYLEKKKARHMDRFAQFAMVSTQEALWQSELALERVDPTRVAVVVGSGIGGIITLSEQFQVLQGQGATRVSPFLIPMMLADMAPAEISMALGTKGPNFCTVSSCSSGAEAIGDAWHMIRRGEVDVAIAGGSEAPICPIAMAGFNSCQALSRRNDDPKAASRPFDVDRDGFVMGEGAAILVLESLESVRHRDAQVLAELVGYAATSDAYHITQPAPEGEGAARAMRLALHAAELSPRDIDYINAHGTSTPLNDKFETIAVKKVFGDHAYKLFISSTKSMTGHLLGASGGVELAACMLALEKGIVPPTINYEYPDPDCDLDYVPNTAIKKDVKVLMSNSLGFGGHNASLIMKKYESSSS